MKTKIIMGCVICAIVCGMLVPGYGWVAESLITVLQELHITIAGGSGSDGYYQLMHGEMTVYAHHAMSTSLYSYMPEGVAIAAVEPLQVIISEPDDNTVIADSMLTIRGVVNRHDAALTINGTSVPIDNNSFEYLTGLVFGENVFVIRATVPEGDTVEIVRTVTREVGGIDTAADVLNSVQVRSDMIADCSMTVAAVDLLNGTPVLGESWSRLYLARDAKIRTEMYDSPELGEPKVVTVSNGPMQYEKQAGIEGVSSFDLRQLGGLSEDDVRKLNYEFETAAFIQGHTLVLDSVDETTQCAWVSATPLFEPAPYEKVRLCINWEEGLVHERETFYNGEQIHHVVVDVTTTVDGIVMPTIKRSTMFLPQGEHVTTFVYSDILVNQGLSESLFMLSE